MNEAWTKNLSNIFKSWPSYWSMRAHMWKDHGWHTKDWPFKELVVHISEDYKARSSARPVWPSGGESGRLKLSSHLIVHILVPFPVLQADCFGHKIQSDDAIFDRKLAVLWNFFKSLQSSWRPNSAQFWLVMIREVFSRCSVDESYINSNTSWCQYK